MREVALASFCAFLLLHSGRGMGYVFGPRAMALESRVE
jgi:hypothetical protein